MGADSRRVPRSLLRTVCGALLAAAVAATSAQGREAEAVLPGQKLWGEVDPDAQVRVLVRGLRDARLSVSCKAWRGTRLEPELELIDPAGRPVDLAPYRKAKGGRAQLRRVPLEVTGSYQIVVGGRNGTSGGFDLATKAAMPRSLRGALAVPEAQAETEIEFDALPGDVAVLAVKPAKKSSLRPRIVRFVDAGGTATELDAERRSPPVTVAVHGSQRFVVTGDDTAGDFTWSLKVVRAKAPKPARDAAEVLALGNVSGRIVIDEEDARDAPAAAAKRESPKGRRAPVVRTAEMIVSAPGGPDDVRRALEASLPGRVRTEVVAGLSDEGPWLVRVEHLGRHPRHDRRAQAMTRAVAKSAGLVPGVRWAEPNGLVWAFRDPNDTRWQEQWDMRYLRLPQVWEETTGSSSVTIAIVDTGSWNHPDLPAQTGGFDFVADSQSALDGNGWDADPTDAARVFHGVHVSGTAAASTNNRDGIAGAAWTARLLPVRVLGQDGGTWFDVAAGIRWAAGLPVSGAPSNPTPAHVINMSLGGSSPSATVQSACDAAHQKGAVLVAAAGNEGTSVPSYPAAYGSVIAVYALDSNLVWSSYSNWGNWISVGAPGGDQSRGLPGILSTWVDAATLQPTYTELQGTSMAAPHVAGVAALLLSVNPALTPVEVQTALESTAMDLGPPGFDVDFGYGMVDAYAALQAVKPQPVTASELTITPPVLEFGRLTQSLTAYLSHSGTAPLPISAVSATTDDGGDWLSAAASGGSTPAVLTVTVDQADLTDGAYSGTVRVTTPAGVGDVPIHVIRIPPQEIQLVRVAAVDLLGREVQVTGTSAALDYRYELRGLPLGPYRIVATADLDEDSEITRVDEFRGSFPLPRTPALVEVAAHELDVEGTDFPLERLDAFYEFDGAGGRLIEGAVAVRAVDAHTRTPVSLARVFLGSGLLAGVTDARGRAVLSGGVQGPAVLSVAADGYATQTRAAADAQFNGMRLVPLAPPPTVTVDVTLSGLGPEDTTIHAFVGDVFAAAPHDGSPAAVMSVVVPRTAPSVMVAAVAYAADGRVTKHASRVLDLVGGGADHAVSLAAAAPVGGPRGRSVTAFLPSTGFTPAGAVVGGAVRVLDAAGRLVPLGRAALAPGAPGWVWWAGPGSPSPPLPMRFELFAADTAGRSSRHVFTGNTDLLLVFAEHTLESPALLTFPGDGAEVPALGLTFNWTPTPGSNLQRLVIEDLDTGARFVTWLTGSASSYAPPRLPGNAYPRAGGRFRFSVECLSVPGFSFRSFLEEGLEDRAVVHTFSGWRLFRTAP